MHFFDMISSMALAPSSVNTSVSWRFGNAACVAQANMAKWVKLKTLSEKVVTSCPNILSAVASVSFSFGATAATSSGAIATKPRNSTPSRAVPLRAM